MHVRPFKTCILVSKISYHEYFKWFLKDRALNIDVCAISLQLPF